MSLYHTFQSHNGRIYCALITLRVLLTFTGLGYIHPDEYFQNGEVTAGAILGWHHLKTWEWDTIFPCRSILPPLLTTGLPMIILKQTLSGNLGHITRNVSSRAVFLLERLSALALSFVLDICVSQLVPIARSQALLLLASSHVVMTFQVRPFSNSVEACLVALAIAILGRMLISQRNNGPTDREIFSTQTSWFAVIIVLGIMTRITFTAFVFPVAAEVLLLSLQVTRVSGRVSIRRWMQALTMPLCTGLVALCGAIAMDTLYFSGESLRFVLTPYNNLLYNMSPDNLAKHGLHPRWLHIAVNMPLIVGPGLIFYGILAARLFPLPSGYSYSTSCFIACTLCIIFSLTVLSLQPHQEPRFLTPLVVPFVVLVTNSGYIEAVNRIFLVTWIIGNAALTLLFGVLHQGGVVPSLLHLNGQISSLPSSHNYITLYWKTYMPPWHLLGIPEGEVLAGRASVADLAGRSSTDVEEYLSSLRDQRPEGTILYLVTPEFAMRSLGPSMAHCFTIDKRVYPHLDLDHIPESIEVGWPGGISLGVYVTNLDCIGS
ncbi:Alg9-like mannosyltransferase family-domain-containing protein [Irpex lacteus]|nr:Alg9-like mannosyltransferase family-domain-containing protein [Irpex lacteus]